MSKPREYSVEIKKHVANVGYADEIRNVTVFDLHLANRFNVVIPVLMHVKGAIDQDSLVEVFSSDTTLYSIFSASFVQVASIMAFMQRNCYMTKVCASACADNAMSVADTSKKLDKEAFVERLGKATACGYAIMVGSTERSVAGHFDSALLGLSRTMDSEAEMPSSSRTRTSPEGKSLQSSERRQQYGLKTKSASSNVLR